MAMTRRKFLATSAGATAVAISGAGLAGAAAKAAAAAPARLEGIWPYCVRWSACPTGLNPEWSWRFFMRFRGVPLKTFMAFANGGRCQLLVLPFPGGVAIHASGRTEAKASLGTTLSVEFGGCYWSDWPINPRRFIEVDLDAKRVRME